MRTKICGLLVLAGVVGLTAPVIGGTAPAPGAPQDERAEAKAELKEKLDATDDNDAEALYQLALWAESKGLKTDAKRILRRVIRADKDHEKAREALGYVRYPPGPDGEWMTEREVEREKRKQFEAEQEALGLRKWRNPDTGEDEWVPEEDYEKLRQGLVKVDNDGEEIWVTRRQAERIKAGMVLQPDGTWMTPDEVEKRNAGYFKCGEEWLTKEQADEYHSNMQTPWEFEIDHVVMTTTCGYDFAQSAIMDANKAILRAYEVLGLPRPDPENSAKIPLIVVKEINDYNTIGGQVQDEHDANMSSTYACFSTLDPNTNRVLGVVNYSYPIGGEGDPKYGDMFTKMMIRHAAVEAALRNLSWEPPPPRWLVLGLATYCSRYWDPYNATGVKENGKWSLGYLQRLGGTSKLDSYFDPFQVTLPTILQSGLVFSFLAHGELPPKVDEQWKVLLATIQSDDRKDLDKILDRFTVVLARDGEKAFLEYTEKLGA